MENSNEKLKKSILILILFIIFSKEWVDDILKNNFEFLVKTPILIYISKCGLLLVSYYMFSSII